MESSERELRQFQLMERTLGDFLSGQVSIDTVLGNLRGLLGTLEETSEDWTRAFKEKWNVVEVEYASSLNSGAALPDASAPGIRDSTEAMLAMVRGRISVLDQP